MHIHICIHINIHMRMHTHNKDVNQQGNPHRWGKVGYMEMGSGRLYDELLEVYTEHRSKSLENVGVLEKVIESLEKKIEKYSKEMDEADKVKDPCTYQELFINRDACKELIEKYYGEIACEELRPSISGKEARELYKKIAVETKEIKAEYNRAIAEALKPIIEQTIRTYTDLYLLELAKHKIRTNLERKKHDFEPEKFFKLAAMEQVDGLLKCNAFKSKAGADWMTAAKDAVSKQEAMWT